jgi:hypothetical protein
LAHGIADEKEHHRNCRGGLLGRPRRQAGYCHQNVYLGCDKFGRQGAESLVLLSGEAIF